MTEQGTSRRMTVQEAAEALGTTVDAVRMRARRGSLESEKEPDGRVYVWLNGDSSETKPRLDGEPDALISAKNETIRVLSEQLEAEREARRRADTIIAQLTQANAALVARVPELEAPREPSEVPETVEEAPEEAESRWSAAGGAQEGTEHQASTLRDWSGDVVQEGASEGGRPWWRRVFGG